MWPDGLNQGFTLCKRKLFHAVLPKLSNVPSSSFHHSDCGCKVEQILTHSHRNSHPCSTADWLMKGEKRQIRGTERPSLYIHSTLALYHPPYSLCTLCKHGRMFVPMNERHCCIEIMVNALYGFTISTVD